MLLFTFLGTKKSVTVRKKNCKSVSKKALIEFFFETNSKKRGNLEPIVWYSDAQIRYFLWD